MPPRVEGSPAPSEATPCPGCGLQLPAEQGPTHAYMTSSPACWRLFGEVLAREFGDPAWFSPHQLTVDAYAAQHPGRPGRREAQSVALHLTTLGLVFERGADPADGPKLHKRMAHRPEYTWLEPPSMEGRMTVADVRGAPDPSAHEDRVRRWARDVWDAWSGHHATIWRWLDQSLGNG